MSAGMKGLEAEKINEQTARMADRIATLESALKPFAAWATGFDGDAVEYPAPDTLCLAIRLSTSNRTKLTVGDLRAARAALAAGEG